MVMEEIKVIAAYAVEEEVAKFTVVDSANHTDARAGGGGAVCRDPVTASLVGQRS